MSTKAKAYIAGAYEHPTRKAPDKSLAQLHAEVARGALEDAGLTKDDVDGYFCAGDAPGMGPLSMVDYMNLKCRHIDSTDVGGSSYLVHVGHACEAIAAGKCDGGALITLAGRPRSDGQASGTGTEKRHPRTTPDVAVGTARIDSGHRREHVRASSRQRHMHDHGTTSEQLAWIKVAGSSACAAQPEHAMLRDPSSRWRRFSTRRMMASDPLHQASTAAW